MTDRKKIIKGLECIAQKRESTANRCKDCGYSGYLNYTMCGVKDIASDALALLKRQEPKEIDLVEQSLFAKIGLCPECGEKLYSGMHPNYCGFCGQAVKWK